MNMNKYSKVLTITKIYLIEAENNSDLQTAIDLTTLEETRKTIFPKLVSGMKNRGYEVIKPNITIEESNLHRCK